MDQYYVGQLYLGKSKLNLFDCKGNLISGLNLVSQYLNPFIKTLEVPQDDYWVRGNYNNKGFCLNPKGKHILLVTGIPLDIRDVNSCKRKHTLWTSYYQDGHRGYLFQILPINKFFNDNTTRKYT